MDAANLPCRNTINLKMKSRLYLVLILSLLVTTSSASEPIPETSVKHLDLPDLTSFEQAKSVFLETTEILKTTLVQQQDKKPAPAALNHEALNKVHLTTYSLEKAVAYFAENLTGEQQAQAVTIAEVVEQMHISSENDRAEETRNNLHNYFKLADVFSETL